MILHVAFSQSDKFFWASFKPFDLSNKLGRDYESFHYRAPSLLESFVLQNPDMEEYFYKGFAYWVLCSFFGFKEDPNRYGLLKRRLCEFSKKLFRAVLSIANKIAMEIRKKY